MQETSKNTSFRLPNANNTTLGRCEIVELGEMQLKDANGVRTLAAGPALALEVPPEMLRGADLEGGVQMCSGVLADGERVVALTFLRGGEHLAVAVTDLGDPEIQRYAAKSLDSGHMLVLLIGDDRDVLTVHPLDEMLRERLSSSLMQQPADLLLYARAVRRAVEMVVDKQTLRELNIDMALINGRSVAVHIGAGAVAGTPVDSSEKAPIIH